MTTDWGSFNGSARVNETARVLVVDDDEVLRELVTATLALARFEVATATDGRTALALIEKKMPDLVLLDVSMPDLSGIEVCRQLRSTARTRTLPIIMLTARVHVQSELEGMMAGADIYLPKPFSPRSLLANIDKLLFS